MKSALLLETKPCFKNFAVYRSGFEEEIEDSWVLATGRSRRNQAYFIDFVSYTVKAQLPHGRVEPRSVTHTPQCHSQV